mgnify:CR=1 FL=1
MCAVKAALSSGGFLPGGGSALLQAQFALDGLLAAESASTDWRHGVVAARRACFAPFEKTASNSIGSDDVAGLRERVLASGLSGGGINFARRDFSQNSEAHEVEDLVAVGVIDPVLVVKNSLLYGASIASILLTADCAVL